MAVENIRLFSALQTFPLLKY